VNLSLVQPHAVVSLEKGSTAPSELNDIGVEIANAGGNDVLRI